MGCAATKDKGVKDEDRHTKAQNRACFDDHYFTQKEKEIILETWGNVNNNKVEKGVQIFLKIFEKKPDAKQLFPFRDLTGDDLTSNTTFRLHARRFMDAIQNTVEHLDALDVSCGPTLILLGKRHVWIKELKSAGYMEAFVESVASVFEKELPNNSGTEVYDTWRKVFSFLVNKLFEGYDQEAAGCLESDKQSKSGAKRGEMYLQSKQPHNAEHEDKSETSPQFLKIDDCESVGQPNCDPSPLDVDNSIVPLNDAKTPQSIADHYKTTQDTTKHSVSNPGGTKADNIIIRTHQDR